jgi:hypothetical protein
VKRKGAVFPKRATCSRDPTCHATQGAVWTDDQWVSCAFLSDF